jgi:CBS domain-containing protein
MIYGVSMTKLVKDLMHPGVITCKPSASLGQVAVLLNQHQVHALFVTDRDGRILGVISDFDLVAGEWLSSDSESLTVMRKLTASDLMTHPVDSVEANISLAQAVNLLMEKSVSRLLVTENGKPVGIISLSDFIASIASEIKTKR